MNQGELITLSYDPNWPTDKMVNDYIKKAMDSLTVGNWFLLKHAGHLYISKEKPLRIDSKNWTLEGLDHSGWLQLDEDGNTFWKAPYSALKRDDFNCLELPEILDEDSPLEIEIMKSGNVYYYES